MARGGQRQGNPAKAGAYANRSDLRSTQPITTVPGQPYGEATAQQNQQRAIPLANGAGAPAGPAPVPPPSVAPGAQAPGGPPTPPSSPLIGNLGSLFDPTAHPNVPVTDGAALGPGAGPEALGTTPGGLSDGNASAMLNAIARSSNSPEIALLAQHAASLGQ